MKKILSLAFLLCFSLVLHSQDVSTNVVQLTEAQYAALTNSIAQLRQSTTNIILFLDSFQRSNPSVGATNQLRIIQAALNNIMVGVDNFTSMLFWDNQFGCYNLYPNVNNDGSLTVTSYYAGLPDSLEAIQANIAGVMRLFHQFVSGSLDGSYDTSQYNFVELVGLIEMFYDEATHFIFQIKNLLEDFKNDFASWSIVNTNQIDTIIYLLNRQDTNQTDVITNTLEVITNILDQIGNSFDESKDLFEEMKDDIKSIRDSLEDGFPGSGSGGTNDTSSADLSYFDRWMKQWIERYFYPDDSYEVFEINDYNNLVYRYLGYGDWVGGSFVNKIISFEVPFLGFHKNGGFAGNDIATPLESPNWVGAFDNTLHAYNSGHTNFYDVTSALLTDIQSVNAQHYALFYTLATNILLSGVDDDASEVSNQFAQIEEMADRITSLTNNIALAISDGVKPVEDKFKEFSDECKAVTDYLSGMSKIPVNDYYFNLPTFEIFGEELGGMEIVLHLTDESFLTVLEVLHVFFLMMWWVTVLGVFFLIVRLCYKMFFWLYKTFLFTTFMSSES